MTKSEWQKLLNIVGTPMEWWSRQGSAMEEWEIGAFFGLLFGTLCVSMSVIFFIWVDDLAAYILLGVGFLGLMYSIGGYWTVRGFIRLNRFVLSKRFSPETPMKACAECGVDFPQNVDDFLCKKCRKRS